MLKLALYIIQSVRFVQALQYNLHDLVWVCKKNVYSRYVIFAVDEHSNRSTSIAENFFNSDALR